MHPRKRSTARYNEMARNIFYTDITSTLPTRLGLLLLGLTFVGITKGVAVLFRRFKVLGAGSNLGSVSLTSSSSRLLDCFALGAL